MIISDMRFKFGEKSWRISALSLLGFLYFCRTSLVTLAQILGLNITVVLAIILSIWMVTFFTYSIQSPKNICADGVALIAFVFLFFLLTLLVHPDYQRFYENPVNDGRFSAEAVFSVGAGIYAYYHIRLFEKERRELYELFCTVPYIILFLNIWKFFFSRTTGYDMGFGYDMEIAAILFMGRFLYERNSKMLLVFSITAMVVALMYGSRACIVGYFVFIALFFLWQRRFTVRKFIIIAIGFLVVIVFQSRAFLLSIYHYLLNFGIQPRILQFLASGRDLAKDSSRMEVIWPKLIQELRSMSLFKIYGAFGDRQFIPMKYTYAHNFILEILFTFGIFFGGLFLVWLFVTFVRTLRENRDTNGLLLLAFGSFSLCRLFFSSSFWYEPYFWSLIALMVNCLKEKKNDRGNQHDMFHEISKRQTV